MDVVNVGDLYEVHSWSKSSSGIFKCINKIERNGRRYLEGLRVMKPSGVPVMKATVSNQHDISQGTTYPKITKVDVAAINKIFDADVEVARIKANFLMSKL